MNLVQIAAATGFAATAWYLAELFLFASAFRERDEALWIEFGRPERFGISGQMTFLLIALGVKKLPPDAAARYQARFMRIRILLAILLCSFAVLSAFE